MCNARRSWTGYCNTCTTLQDTDDIPVVLCSRSKQGKPPSSLKIPSSSRCMQHLELHNPFDSCPPSSSQHLTHPTPRSLPVHAMSMQKGDAHNNLGILGPSPSPLLGLAHSADRLTGIAFGSQHPSVSRGCAVALPHHNYVTARGVRAVTSMCSNRNVQ